MWQTCARELHETVLLWQFNGKWTIEIFVALDVTVVVQLVKLVRLPLHYRSRLSSSFLHNALSNGLFV